MTSSKPSTEKQVQAEIAVIEKDVQMYRQEGFASFQDMCDHLISFNDFRVFLPIVCHEHFSPVWFETITINSKRRARSIFIMNRIYEQARFLGGQMGKMFAPKTPAPGSFDLRKIRDFFDLDEERTARLTAKFFIDELPIGASGTFYGKALMEREGVSQYNSFNALMIDKHYIDGLSGMVEFYMRYGRALPVFHPNNIKIGDKVNVHCLMAALEHGEAQTVALHIRAFEQISRTQFTRLSNKLKKIQLQVLPFLTRADKPYYYAFLNGFYQVKLTTQQ